MSAINNFTNKLNDTDAITISITVSRPHAQEHQCQVKLSVFSIRQMRAANGVDSIEHAVKALCDTMSKNMKLSTDEYVMPFTTSIHLSQFDKLKRLINDNEVFTRATMVRTLKLHGPTVDTYRRKLTVAGFVKSTGRGKYKRLKSIPTELTTADLDKEVASIKLKTAKQLI